MNIFDNPILVKHLRSRFRRSQILTPAVIVFVLSIFIAYASYANNGFTNGTAFGFLVGLQTVILPIIGATQISASVGGARESGILDFHRVSPLSPLATTLGFLFGAPVREYTLAAITLPFCFVCVWYDSPNFWGFVQTEISLLLTTWLLHTISLFTALSTKKPKAGTKGIVGLMIFLFIFGGQVSFLALSNATTFLQAAPTVGFFGIQLHWLINALIYAVPTLGFLLLASVRKMRSERAHPLSKAEAVFCLATQVFLILGGTWFAKGFSPLVLIVLYTVSAFSCILIKTITPNAGEYTKGIRRAERQGVARLSYWDELSLNRVSLACICLIVLAGVTTVWKAIADAPVADLGKSPIYGYSQRFDYSIAIATAVLTVAYFGLALQYFSLAFPRRGGTLLGLFFFFFWLVPLISGAITLRVSQQLSLALVSLSPLGGLATSSMNVGEENVMLARGAAIGPAILFFILFNSLVTVARRKTLAQIHTGSDRSKPAGPVSSPIGDESDLILN